MEWPKPGSEDLGLSEKLQFSLEAEQSVLEGLLECVDELAAKNFPQHPFGEKVIFPRANPAGVIRREAAGGRDTMNMRMNFELLAPGVQHTEETDFRTEGFPHWCGTEDRRGPSCSAGPVAPSDEAG